MSKYLRAMHERTKFISEEAVWPPNQAKLVVSVAFIHYNGKRSKQELFQLATIHKEGAPAIDELISFNYQQPPAKRPRLDYSKVTKNIADIFAADPTDLTETDTGSTKAPKRILIEGAPGIGKTILAKEIVYQWATNQILTEIKIAFLIYLRDPQLQSIKTIKQLFEYMSRDCLDNEQITIFTTHFVNTEGQKLCIVMDGFDEYPSSLQKCSIIVNIIKGIDLPEAIVVVTSRSNTTVSLHHQVDRRIDILGFPKEEREKYISEIFSKSPEQKEALDKYLKQRPAINRLCFVPFHLAILLYLFQKGCLPETLKEINESFIIHTIYRHLERYGPTPLGTVDQLSKLPKQVLDYIQGLSVLAFNGLQENKLVFTLEEIKQACPCFEDTKGAINGYGLLQAVEHFPHEGGAAGRTTSFNFLHYTMQEFLSALHVSNLPSEQQSSLMKKTFWEGHYNFMWMMFVGIVGIESDVFINFVSKGKEYKRKKGIRMAENILSDKRKRLHVFQCYMEAKSSAVAPDVISDVFKDGKINMNGVKLLPHHISSLMTYVSNSSMQWNTLQLNQCNITDIGMSALEQFISESTSTLEYVDLSDNNSSPWGVYCAIIRYCIINSLTLCGGYGINDHVNKIKECLQMNTKLMSLTLYKITNDGAIRIAEAIQVNTTLQKLNISNNSICDDGAARISNCLKYNVSLKELNISQNNITNRGIRVITKTIQMNSTLQNINISKNRISTEGLLYFMEAVKNNCTLRVVNITHNNVTRSGFTNIQQCIENLQQKIQIISSWNTIKESKLVTKICSSCAPDNIEEDVWSFDEYDADHLVTCLSECLKENNIEQKVDLNNYTKNMITSEGAIKIAEAILVNKTLRELDISFNSISDYGAAVISDALISNNSVQILNMSCNKITGKGAIMMAGAIVVNETLQELDIRRNNISDNGAAAISNALKSNNSLQIISMSYNNISSEGAIKIAAAIEVNKTLQELDISRNNISDDGVAAISDAMKTNNSLQMLNMSSNNITSEGAKSIAGAIKVNTTLHTLNLDQENINDTLSFNERILTAVYHNNTLIKLTLPYVHCDDNELVSSKKIINEKRRSQGINTLTCYH